MGEPGPSQSSSSARTVLDNRLSFFFSSFIEEQLSLGPVFTNQLAIVNTDVDQSRIVCHQPPVPRRQPVAGECKPPSVPNQQLLPVSNQAR